MPTLEILSGKHSGQTFTFTTEAKVAFGLLSVVVAAFGVLQVIGLAQHEAASDG